MSEQPIAEPVKQPPIDKSMIYQTRRAGLLATSTFYRPKQL